MVTHFEILIDASGSMGLMEGSKDKEQYLLPDGKSTRTDLVKKILMESLIPKLSFTDSLHIKKFRNYLKKDKDGNYIFKILKEKNLKEEVIEKTVHDSYPLMENVYKGGFNLNIIERNIINITNPEPAGTPIYHALSKTLEKSKVPNSSIIIISDGDANDKVNFDVELIKLINEKNIDFKVYFIGIDQNEAAQKKSKNIAEFTKGKYVNVKALNYDKALFDNFLFEVKTSITQDAIAASVVKNSPLESQQQQQQSTIAEPKEEVYNEEPKAEEVKSKTDVESENLSNIEGSKLEQEVANNSKSLKLISDQLQTISSQVSYLSKAINITDADEFLISDENEELNKQTGYHCEQLLFDKFNTFNWKDLIWLNQKGEQYKPYDFTLSKDNETIYVECKGTRSNSNEFALTRDEWLFYLNHKSNYRMYFVKSIIGQQIEIYRFDDLLNSIDKQELLPFSSINRKVKADRIWFQVNNKELWSY